jgi:hypothetical protein
MKKEMISYGQSWYKTYGHAGKTLNWCQTDAEDLFERNIADPVKRAQLEKFGWTRDNISYTFNKDGFRSEEFTYEPNDSVLFLGCSITTGIGVDLESSWAYKVANTFGLRRYNLGIGAGSADTCFRLAHHWIPRLRPKYVVMLTPMVGRMEVVLDEQGIVQLLPNSFAHLDQHKRNEPFYNSWLSHPANTELNRLKNVMGVQTICNSIGVPLVEMSVDDTYFKGKAIILDSDARDLMHPGREWNEYIAQMFIEKLSELPKIEMEEA